MNVRDIEETIRTLEARHPGLNEAMLVTLMKAGGWEEKDIETARSLFKSPPSAVPKKEEEPVQAAPAPAPVPGKDVQAASAALIDEPHAAGTLPEVAEVPAFEPVADEAHRIEAPVADVPAAAPLPELSVVSEPVSLIVPDNAPTKEKKEELPHNLPLRPFETSEHIWPFSRYRDVFYGEEAQPHIVPQDSYNVHHVQNSVLRTQVTGGAAPSREPSDAAAPPAVPSAAPELAPKQQPIARDALASSAPSQEKVVIVERTGDEKLIIMACIMLLAILLLLGYMYSNGRL